MTISIIVLFLIQPTAAYHWREGTHNSLKCSQAKQCPKNYSGNCFVICSKMVMCLEFNVYCLRTSIYFNMYIVNDAGGESAHLVLLRHRAISIFSNWHKIQSSNFYNQHKRSAFFNQCVSHASTHYIQSIPSSSSYSIPTQEHLENLGKH